MSQDRFAGRRTGARQGEAVDQRAGALQTKYGYIKEQAEAEIDRRMAQTA